MRKRLASDRFSAAVLLAAAALGLFLANTGWGAAILSVKWMRVGLGVDLSAGQWVTDFLLVIFFFIVAVELKYELVSGELNSWRKALVPALAAVGGVITPALIYTVVSGSGELARGWPVPTATDIAFALGVLAIFGTGLPSRMRAFLLALAVLDDLIGIAIIAVFFAHDLNPASFLAALACVAGFWLVGRSSPGTHRVLVVAALAVLALAAWYFMHDSGIHTTIAGVLLGLVIPRHRGGRLARWLKPWSNLLILPLFAFTAALVVLPGSGHSGVGPAFFAVALALPVGKLIGITLGGLAAAVLTRGRGSGLITGWDLIALAMTGGVGFTVSLLMNELAFAGAGPVRDQGVLGVLTGSAVSIVLGGVLIAWRARHYRAAARSSAASAVYSPL